MRVPDFDRENEDKSPLQADKITGWWLTFWWAAVAGVILLFLLLLFGGK